MKKTLKQQNPWAEFNLIDLLVNIDPSSKNKYVPFMLKLLRNHVEQKGSLYTEHLKECFTDENQYKIDQLKPLARMVTSHTISMLPEKYKDILTEFDRHSNAHRMKNVDINQFETIEEVINANQMANINELQKELSKSVHVLLDNERWLVIKPLTREASMKYGASTKWCTAQKDNEHYFYQYSSDGVLIYIIDKIKQRKIGLHIKAEKTMYYPQIYFYDTDDIQLDSMFVGMDEALTQVVWDEYNDGNMMVNTEFIRINYPEIYADEWKPKIQKNKVKAINEAATSPIPTPSSEDSVLINLVTDYDDECCDVVRREAPQDEDTYNDNDN